MQQLLRTADQREAIRSRAFLTRLSTLIIDGHVVGNRIDLYLDLADVPLPPKKAETIGLILNELLTNCLKHAFPKGRSGTIEVQFNDLGATQELLVADDGVGPQEGGEPLREGLGTQLVAELLRRIDATAEREYTDGWSVCVTFPAREGLAD